MDNPFSKIRDEQMLSITELAALFGVSYNQMQNMIYGRTEKLTKPIRMNMYKAGLTEEQVDAWEVEYIAWLNAKRKKDIDQIVELRQAVLMGTGTKPVSTSSAEG